MDKEDIKKAVEDLDALAVEESAGLLDRIAKALRDPKSLLRKGGLTVEAEEQPEKKDDKVAKSEEVPAAEGELIVSGKKKKVHDNAATGQEGHEEAEGGDAVAKDAQARKSAAEPGSEEFEVLDADGISKALVAIQTGISETREDLKKSHVAVERIEALEKAVESLAENLGTVLGAIAKSHVSLHKSLDAKPLHTPHPGVIGIAGARTEEKKSGLTKRELQTRIEKAHGEGTITGNDASTLLANLDSRGVDGTVASMPAEIAKSLDLQK